MRCTGTGCSCWWVCIEDRPTTAKFSFCSMERGRSIRRRRISTPAPSGRATVTKTDDFSYFKTHFLCMAYGTQNQNSPYATRSSAVAEWLRDAPSLAYLGGGGHAPPPNMPRPLVAILLCASRFSSSSRPNLAPSLQLYNLDPPVRSIRIIL